MAVQLRPATHGSGPLCSSNGPMAPLFNEGPIDAISILQSPRAFFSLFFSILSYFDLHFYGVPCRRLKAAHVRENEGLGRAMPILLMPFGPLVTCFIRTGFCNSRPRSMLTHSNNPPSFLIIPRPVGYLNGDLSDLGHSIKRITTLVARHHGRSSAVCKAPASMATEYLLRSYS